MISIKNFHKKFNIGTLNEVYALKGVNLDINTGDFITIIGTNGSGKSTLLNAVAGSFSPDEGDVIINGVNVTNDKEHKRAKFISRVFQNPFSGTAADMTIAENLHLASLRGMSRMPKIGLNSSALSIYKEELKQLEMQMEERLDSLIGTLSGGQRQAVTLLMAIIKKPLVLLLDEHTAALDPKSANQIINLTKRFIQRDNLTTIMVTHSMQQALELGNRTIMMNKGEIIDDISLNEKKRLTVNDLLNKFSEIRKKEKLNNELILELEKEYI